MGPLADLLGESTGIRAVRDRLRRLLERQQDARRVPPVLIEGETGTGKGLLARVIHRAGPRPDGPFVDVNCAAIPETLLEAEMFGFERGAFTDARRAKPGLFQAAHRGTIFLDEVGLLPEALQAKLLKVLEERSVRRLGSTRDEPVDVWILTATNEDLRAAVHERRFREDLYHRLAVLTLTMPPLRARGADILVLAEHFLARACADYGVPPKTLAADAHDALLAYPWPGNVRELGNLMERVALLSPEPEVTAETLGLPDTALAKEPEAAREETASSLEEAVRDRVAEVLRQTKWNISRSAALLGISRNTLRARIEKYGLKSGASAPPRAARPATRAPVAPNAVPTPAPPAALRWERRRLTLLRATLTPGGESDAQLETSRTLEVLIEKVTSFGGRVEGMSPTDVVAAFGLDATEDAPSRAAHAAMAIQKAAARARQGDPRAPGVTVGIHLEQCLVGLGPRAAELDVMAKQRAVQVLVALVERGEPGSVLVTEAAAPFLERRFELLDFAGGALGRVFVLAGRGSSGLGRHVASFVGRHREVELLWSRLESAMRGQGQIVGISGEAGIGKSRLLYEFHQSVVGKPIGYLEGQCVSYGTATPYLPVLDVLRAACGITDADTPDAARSRVQVALREVGMDPVEGGPYLLHLLGIKEDRDWLQTLEPDAIKARIFDTLRQMWLRRSRQLPLVVAVEDLHWIDTTSEEWFASLAELVAGSRILLVSTYRAGYRPPWIEKSYATQVALQPLAPDDSLRVLRAVLGTERVSDALADRIVAKAEGNPLFLEELARTVREQAGDAPTLAVPDTIQDVLRGRIERLTPGDRRLLEIAAVVGRNVPFSIVQAVAGLSADGLRDAVNRLKSADFLYETSPGPEIEYTFKHALTHEVAYGSLPEDQRRALHAKIVDAIERRHPNRLPEYVERLALHALRAGTWAKAVSYLRQAAMKAFGRAAHREAVTAYEQALAALEHLPASRSRTEQAIDLRLDLRTALLPLGELDRILAYLREAEALAVALDDPQRLGRLFVYLTGQYYLMGDHDRAFEAARRSREIGGTLNDFGLEVSTNSYLGQTCFARGEYARAAALFRRNVDAIVGDFVRERFDLPQLPAVHSRSCLVWCLAELGEFAEAIARGEEAIAIAESVDQPLSLTVACSGLGVVYLRKGEVDRAIPILERGLNLSRSWHIPLWFPRVASALGYAYALGGRAVEALPLLEDAIEQANAMRLVGGHSLAVAWLGETTLLAGRNEAALALARRALALARQNKERGSEAWAQRLLGEIARGSGAPEAERSRECYSRALNLAEELGMRPLAAYCRLGLGQLDVQLGDLAGGAERLGVAKALFSAMEMGLGVALADAALARSR
jgi:transcriptional regulator with AAA-type ATPase domain/tetratricopeptide (TPR) repeat protein